MFQQRVNLRSPTRKKRNFALCIDKRVYVFHSRELFNDRFKFGKRFFSIQLDTSRSQVIQYL